MAAFRRIGPQHAGPSALGILVPPGTRTLVIVRPRSLDFDLLPSRWNGEPASAPEICLFDRDEATQIARRFPAALEEAVASGVNPVETLGSATGKSFQVWVRAGGWFWIVCRRSVGQAYSPLVFASLDEAQRVGEALAVVVWPSAEAVQEYYFNTQRFR